MSSSNDPQKRIQPIFKTKYITPIMHLIIRYEEKHLQYYHSSILQSQLPKNKLIISEANYGKPNGSRT